jgi:hypothetical protein
VKVEEELKRKRAERLGEADEPAAVIEAIRVQALAIDEVIAIDDPTQPRDLRGREATACPSRYRTGKRWWMPTQVR